MGDVGVCLVCGGTWLHVHDLRVTEERKPEMFDADGPTRPLAVLLERMRALTGADPEGEHGEADDLLLEALVNAAGQSEYLGVWETAREIVRAYQSLTKWYA